MLQAMGTTGQKSRCVAEVWVMSSSHTGSRFCAAAGCVSTASVHKTSFGPEAQQNGKGHTQLTSARIRPDLATCLKPLKLKSESACRHAARCKLIQMT